MLRNIPLRFRLLVGVLGSLILVLAAMAFVIVTVVGDALKIEVQQRVQNLVGEKVSQIDSFFSGVGRIPVVLGNASAADRENNEALLRERMLEVVEKNPDVYGSTISFEPYVFYEDQKYFAPYYYRGGPEGTIEYVQFGSDDYIYWEWEWYMGPRDTGGLYWTQPFFDEGAGNIWMVTAAYPVVRDGEFIAVATVDVPIEDVKQDLTALQVGTRGRAVMFDRTGATIAASGVEELTEGSPVTDWVEQGNSSSLRGLVDRMLAGEEGIIELPDPFGQGGQIWAIYTTVPSTQWHVVTFVSVDDMLAPVRRVSRWVSGVSLAGILVLAAVVLLIANTITGPIGVLRDEALAIAGGDLTRRVPAKGRDEVSALGHAFNQMADELQDSLVSMEQRVAERTAKLAAAAEVSWATTSELDADRLQREVVDLVRERFDLYYVGLFLADEAGEYAVLRAGTGDAGHEMLSRGHRLAIGGGSMIGQCVARGEARIALDVGAEAVRFNNPALPETRSEMALPLRSRGRVIGAMSVQSTAEAAFDETDISVMQTMADQVATAIDNARLFENAQQTFHQLETTQSRYRSQAWMDYVRARKLHGYIQTQEELLPLSAEVPSAVLEALAKRRSVIARSEAKATGPAAAHSPEEDAVVVPIMFTRQDRPIGALGFKGAETGAHKWNAEDIALVESLSEQFALAAENIRLLDETQRRAARERLAREITDKMRRAADMDTLIQTTVEEMSAILGSSSAFLQLVPGTEIEHRED